MSRRGGTWTGWQDGDVWQDAGVIGEMLDFTDDDIITQQTIEHTKSVIGRCRAMDAAVAFELASAGQNGAISVNDLVTERTKAAYLIETRRVGYGVYRDPTVESCGHDEVNEKTYHFVVAHSAKRCGDEVLVSVATGWNKLGLSESSLENFKGVLSEETISKLCSDTRASDAPLEAYYEYLRAKFGITDDVKFVFTHTIIKEEGHTKGECAWKGETIDVVDEETGETTTKNRVCAHHDGARIRGWALFQTHGTDGSGIDDYEELFLAGRCAYNWNGNQLRDKFVDSDSWVSWETKRRSLVRQVNEREVKKLINKSLARMLKRNDNVVHKEGLRSSAVFSWSDWEWLADITSYIRQTRSKNRKAGDVENGWSYTAVNKRLSYGMEISDFVWTAADEADLKYYKFKVETQKRNPYTWQSNTWITEKCMTSVDLRIFMSRDEAQQAGDLMMRTLNEGGGIMPRRVYVEGEFEPLSDTQVKVTSSRCEFTMNGDIEPEEYLSPKEITRLALTAAPSIVEQHKEKFSRWQTPIKVRMVAKDVVTEGEEVDAE